MKQNRPSLIKKIKLYIYFFSIILISIGVLNVYYISTTYQELSNMRDKTFEIVTISKDIERLMQRHWDLSSQLRFEHENLEILNQTQLIEQEYLTVKQKITVLANQHLMLSKNRSEIIDILYQLRSLDYNFDNYLFRYHRSLNLQKLNRKNEYQLEKNRLVVAKNNLVKSFRDFNHATEKYKQVQLQLAQKKLKYTIIGLLSLAILFSTFHILYWTKFILKLKQSFSIGIGYIEQYLNNRKGTKPTKQISNIENEVYKFINILIKTISDLDNAKEELDKTYKQFKKLKDEERLKLAQHIHDNFGQNIIAMKIELELFKSDNQTLNQQSKNRLDRLILIINDSLKLIKQLSKNLEIPALKQEGLIEAIRHIVNQRNSMGFITFYFNSSINKPLSDSVEAILYQIVTEAINNVLKHSKASKCTISLENCNKIVKLNISDNGLGLPESYEDSIGLKGIKKSVKQLNGKLIIESAPNKGTKLEIQIEVNE